MHRHGPLAYARAALASELLRERAKDVEVQLAAGESADRQMELVATVPAADAGDVAIKLAAAVRQMINIETAAEGPQQAAVFSLVAGALADLVILAGEPIALPARATDLVRSPEDIAYWRSQAAATTNAAA